MSHPNQLDKILYFIKSLEFIVGCCFSLETVRMSKELCSRTKRSARLMAVRTVSGKSHDDVRQSDQQMAEVDQVSGILTLNDDCLLEAFSYLETDDLCAVGGCCQRFSYLAYLIVEKRFRKEDYLCLPREIDEEDSEEAALILKTFGRFVTHLHIGNLNASFGFIRCCQIFRDAGKFVSLLNNCTSLRSLRLERVPLSGIPVWRLEKIFRNIEALELVRCDVSTPKLASMLKRSKRLKHFILGTLIADKYVESDLCSTILNYGANYETLRIKSNALGDINPSRLPIFLKHLVQLKNLKVLEFGNYSMDASDIKMLEKFASLKELTLGNFISSDKFFKAINESVKLKVVKLLELAESIKDELLVSLTDFEVTVCKSEWNGHTYYTYTFSRKK